MGRDLRVHFREGPRTCTEHIKAILTDLSDDYVYEEH